MKDNVDVSSNGAGVDEEGDSHYALDGACGDRTGGYREGGESSKAG